MSEFQIDENFQTPQVVAEFMAKMAYSVSLTHRKQPLVLEPTPGLGGFVNALEDVGFCVRSPAGDFWESIYNGGHYDVIVTNPPFNPVKEMERFVNRAMELSDNVIALLPWSYIINSERRLITLEEFGLESITSLPRKTFPGCRVQVAIFKLNKGYAGPTEFKRYTW